MARVFLAASAKILVWVDIPPAVTVAAHLARTRGLESVRIETPFHSNWLDNSKARQALNWEPNYDALGLVDAAFAYQRAADDPRKVWYVG